jgi:hypothetical protein
VKSLREILVPAVVVAGVFVLPGEAGATVTIESPTLVPGYSSQVTDFTVRCSQPVQFSISAGVGKKVSIDGRARRGGPFSEAVSLEPGQATRIRTYSGRSVSTQTVRCLPEDFPLWATDRKGDPQAHWYVMAVVMKLVPGGQLPFWGPPYVIVVNNHGVPVWWYREESGSPMNARLIGKKTISWSIEGRDGVSSRKLDGRAGQAIYADGALTDAHDISRTRDGGYLVIGATQRACPEVPDECVDLSRWGGPAQATVLDNEVQKLDRRGRLVWRWSTRGNVEPEEGAAWVSSRLAQPLVDTGGRQVYDLFHINSVEEDGSGVIFSARHLDAVYRLGANGRRIDWKLGGTRTGKSLALRGAMTGPNVMGGQHDARRQPDGTISVLDNGTLTWRGPRILSFRVSGRSARVVGEVRDTRVPFSVCCGNATRLAGGNWAVAWGGGSSLVSEITRRGRPVIEMAMPDQLFTYRVNAIEPGRLSASDLRAGMDAQYPR